MTKEETKAILEELFKKYNEEFGETLGPDHVASFTEELLARRAGQFAINEIDKRVPKTTDLMQFQEHAKQLAKEAAVDYFLPIMRTALQSNLQSQALQIANVHLRNCITQEQGDSIAKELGESYVFHNGEFKTKHQAKKDKKK